VRNKRRNGLGRNLGKAMRDLKLEPTDVVKVTIHHTPKGEKETLIQNILCKNLIPLVQRVFTPPPGHRPDQKFTLPTAVIVERGGSSFPIHGSLSTRKNKSSEMHIPI